MQTTYTVTRWNEVVKLDPGLLGVSPADVAYRLALTEQEVGELMLRGYLDVSYVVRNGEVISIVIPERDVQRYAITRQAQRDRFPT